MQDARNKERQSRDGKERSRDRCFMGGPLWSFLDLFQRRCGCEDLHLSNGDFVKALEALSLREPHIDEFGIHAFQIGKHRELFNGDILASPR